MATPIIPRQDRGRLYIQIADALLPGFAQSSGAWSAAEAHWRDVADELDTLTVRRTTGLAAMGRAATGLTRFATSSEHEAELAGHIWRPRRQSGAR